MFCGSCMHDNSLARALMRLGHDCALVPVYTPIRTDEENVSIDRVFFGGVNIFLQQKLPWLRYLPRWLDGFLNHPQVVRAATQVGSKTNPKFLGALTVSMLQGMKGNQAKEVQRLVEWFETELKPDAIVLTNFLIGGALPELRKRLNKPILVTLQGDDIFFDYLPEPYRQQTIDAMRDLVPLVDRFIVNSHYYRDYMAKELRIPMERFCIIPLGIDLTDFRTWPSCRAQSHPTIGYLARLSPEKGLHRLIDAFLRIQASGKGDNIHLKIAGWLGPDHESYWLEQQEKLRRADRLDRVDYVGSVDRASKIQFLQSIDLLCVPTTYKEPKGLYVLEAAAAGVPYVLPSHGAFPELAERLAFGGLFEPQVEEQLDVTLLKQVEWARNSESLRNQRRNALLAEIDIDTMAQRLLREIRS